jgi:glutaminase
MNYIEIFREVISEIEFRNNTGIVADYIPELKKVDPNKFGVHLIDVSGLEFGVGNSDDKFSIQSISKVFSLVMAYQIKGESLWKRVGVEPSGTPFNSLVQLEYDNGIPRNPFINAGAIVICDVLMSELKNPEEEILAFIRKLAGNESIDYNNTIASSEKDTGFRNYALVNLMKSFGNIKNDISELMDFYFKLCSIEMTCKELSKTMLFLANNGTLLKNGEQILTISKCKRVNAVMQLCGLYDEAGEFSFRVGLPGKSGVGGGIIAIHPGHYSICCWSPRLNKKGNSWLGIEFLERFTTKTSKSIF